ncbi:MAG: HNH endonuclease [Spirochaetae bacterium HGW-Spirochaetae-3]|nr:MAG: HNH endonuclease [Spirochaetae bacterium HGW-Spirochaetae-3]
MKKSKDCATAEMTDVTRSIKRSIESELWGRAAGRCEFDGCNKILYRSPLTQEQVNIAEKAHIYSFSEHGARGHGIFAKDKERLNSIDNLMLLCHDCHKLIDSDIKGIRYSAELLRKWKHDHEQLVEQATGIAENKRTHILVFGANTGKVPSKIIAQDVMEAVFPDWLPDSPQPTDLSMSWNGEDHTVIYWQAQLEELKRNYVRMVGPKLSDPSIKHFSIFALAPIPLLFVLGSLITDKLTCRTFQLHREPAPSWKWREDDCDLGFKIIPPTECSGIPVLALSLSDSIDPARIGRSVQGTSAVWKITVSSPHNDLIQSEQQLSEFRKILRSCIVQIGEAHGKDTPIHILPAIPVSCAIELGRIRMPKADSPWLIYDFNLVHDYYKAVLEIGTDLTVLH